jgi:hypothetical protein
VIEYAILARRDLPLHTLHEHDQFLVFVIPFGLLAHLLEILRSIRHAIRHEGGASVLKKA